MAFVAYIICILVAVAGRMAIQYKKTGDHGIRFVTAKSSTAAKISGLLFTISLSLFFTLSLLEVLGYLRAQVTLGWHGSIIGTAICTLGIGVISIAQQQMGDAWRLGVDESDRTQLVTHGLYTYVRNPIYCGIMLFGIGFFILLPHGYVIAALATGYASIELQVRYVEESFMMKLHGDRFRLYSQQVNRYLPKLSAFSGVRHKLD